MPWSTGIVETPGRLFFLDPLVGSGDGEHKVALYARNTEETKLLTVEICDASLNLSRTSS